MYTPFGLFIPQGLCDGATKFTDSDIIKGRISGQGKSADFFPQPMKTSEKCPVKGSDSSLLSITFPWYIEDI